MISINLFLLPLTVSSVVIIPSLTPNAIGRIDLGRVALHLIISNKVLITHRDMHHSWISSIATWSIGVVIPDRLVIGYRRLRMLNISVVSDVMLIVRVSTFSSSLTLSLMIVIASLVIRVVIKWPVHSVSAILIIVMMMLLLRNTALIRLLPIEQRRITMLLLSIVLIVIMRRGRGWLMMMLNDHSLFNYHLFMVMLAIIVRLL